MRQPIQYTIAQPQQVDGIHVQTTREFKGLNTFDATAIEDTFFTEVSNLDSTHYPAVATRPGYSVVGAKIGSKVVGLASWKGIELHAVFNDGTWRKWNGTSWTTLKSGLDTSAMWSFTNFQGNWSDVNLVGCNGVNGLHRYDGSTVKTFGNAPANINFITTYQNRLWGAKGKELLSCALDQPEAWELFNGNDEDSFGKVIESNRGENINMLSGGLSKLVIGLPNSIRELYGGMPSDFFDNPVTEDVGTINNLATASLKGQLTFIHQNGIYEYSGGTLPSDDFHSVIGNYPITLNTNVAAGTDGEKLYYQTDNDLLVYDTRTNVYAWYVWHGFKATCFLQYKGDLYIGDNTGRILKLGGANDAGTAISWHGVTKPFNNLTMAQRSRWYRLWLIVELSAGSTMQVHLSKSIRGNADWELVQSVSGQSIGAQKVLVPVGKYALENWVRVKVSGTGQAKIYDITRQTRPMPL